MTEDKNRFDFSGYAKDDPLYDTTNKKAIGKMKEETDFVSIRQFLGLRTKMYSMTYGDTGKEQRNESAKQSSSRSYGTNYTDNVYFEERPR